MKKPVFLLIGLVLGLVAGVMLPRLNDAIRGMDRTMERGYQGIRLGMPLAEVAAGMGSEGARVDQFRLTQPGGFEIEYRAAEQSGAVSFVYWRTGVDITYCVGLDKDDRVLYKARGDS